MFLFSEKMLWYISEKTSCILQASQVLRVNINLCNLLLNINKCVECLSKLRTSNASKKSWVAVARISESGRSWYLIGLLQRIGFYCLVRPQSPIQMPFFVQNQMIVFSHNQISWQLWTFYICIKLFIQTWNFTFVHFQPA